MANVDKERPIQLERSKFCKLKVCWPRIWWCLRVSRYIESLTMGASCKTRLDVQCLIVLIETWHASQALRITVLWLRLRLLMYSSLIEGGVGGSPGNRVVHIRPASTTLPKPANSALAPFLLSSSNSLMIPAIMILRSFASALAKISPVPGAHIAGEGIRPTIRV